MSLSAAESAKRIYLYYEGHTFAEIGRQCGVTPGAARLYLQSIGVHVTVSLRGRNVPEHTRRRALELYKRGHSAAQIARTLRISPTCVYSQVRRAGVPMRYPKVSEANRRRWAAKREAQ